MYITERHLAHNHAAQAARRASRCQSDHSSKMERFSPDVISVMATAFEVVCKALEASGRSDITKETIAAKIIELARGGETDPVVLREMALSEFGLSRSAGPTVIFELGGSQASAVNFLSHLGT